MPHDKNGQILKVGDKVNVPCVVKEVHAGDEYCNLSLETEEVMFPGEQKSGMVLNTKQVLKVLVMVILAAVFCGCSSWSPPAGTTVAVGGNNAGDITGTVSVPIATNVTLGGTVTGNPETGAVTGGLVLTFTKAPTDGTRAALLDVGAAEIVSGKGGPVFYLAVWKHGDARQEAALERALREGAVMARPARAR